MKESTAAVYISPPTSIRHYTMKAHREVEIFIHKFLTSKQHGGKWSASPSGRFLHTHIRGGADKSLAQPTSRFRSMESIALLERGVCSCAELQAFSCYRGWKEACKATHAISTTSRRELSSRPPHPPARQGTEGNSCHSKINIRGTCTHRMPPSKTGWPSLNVVIFPPVMRLVLDDPKQWPPRRLLIKFTS